MELGSAVGSTQPYEYMVQVQFLGWRNIFMPGVNLWLTQNHKMCARDFSRKQAVTSYWPYRPFCAAQSGRIWAWHVSAVCFMPGTCNYFISLMYYTNTLEVCFQMPSPLFLLQGLCSTNFIVNKLFLKLVCMCDGEKKIAFYLFFFFFFA